MGYLRWLLLHHEWWYRLDPAYDSKVNKGKRTSRLNGRSSGQSAARLMEVLMVMTSF